METFKAYLIDEFKDQAKGYAAVEFKFGHTSNVKIDRKTNISLKNEVIKVNIKFVDKNMCVLKTATISFENNLLPKIQAKKLINIAPKELENRFNAARRSICNEILEDLVKKCNDLSSKISDLKNYIGVDGIIPSEFKGENISIANESDIKLEVKNKVHYDM